MTRTETVHISATENSCPMLNDPMPYDPIIMEITGIEVTLIPAESLDVAPTQFTRSCIQNGLEQIPTTFACSSCRRHGAIGK